MNAPQCYIYTYVIVSCLFLWQRIAGYGSPFIPQVNRSTSKSVHFVISVPNFTNRKWQKCGQMYINKLKMQFVSSRSAKHIKDSIMSWSGKCQSLIWRVHHRRSSVLFLGEVTRVYFCNHFQTGYRIHPSSYVVGSGSYMTSDTVVIAYTVLGYEVKAVWDFNCVSSFVCILASVNQKISQPWRNFGDKQRPCRCLMNYLMYVVTVLWSWSMAFPFENQEDVGKIT